jgi:hypothetical protein
LEIQQVVGHTGTKKVFEAYLKFKFNLAFYILNIESF